VGEFSVARVPLKHHVKSTTLDVAAPQVAGPLTLDAVVDVARERAIAHVHERGSRDGHPGDLQRLPIREVQQLQQLGIVLPATCQLEQPRSGLGGPELIELELHGRYPQSSTAGAMRTEHVPMLLGMWGRGPDTNAKNHCGRLFS